jgi:solute carrier family 6 GABA transporter-like protein 1
VGNGRNWKIPAFMPFLLRYISGPVLAIILSFAFPEFHKLRYDPMMIAGFILSILGVTMMVLGFIAPRYFNVFVPASRRAEGTEVTIANEIKVEKDHEAEVSETEVKRSASA